MWTAASIRGCSHIMSAKNGGLQTPLPSLSAQNQKLDDKMKCFFEPLPKESIKHGLFLRSQVFPFYSDMSRADLEGESENI